MSLPLIIFGSLTFLVLFAIYYRFIKKRHNKYLVFSSVGDVNSVFTWLSDFDDKLFDLVVYYYGDKDPPAVNADKLVRRKGLKLENFHHFLSNNDISRYDAIWLADDDIVIDTNSINKLFELFSQYNLYLAQPSYTNDSFTPWRDVAVNDPGCILRYTNFVEVGVPVFSTKIIPKLFESFKGAGTGYGLDYIWPFLLGFPKDED